MPASGSGHCSLGRTFVVRQSIHDLTHHKCLIVAWSTHYLKLRGYTSVMLCPDNNARSLYFDHFKVLFARSAFRAGPIHRYVLPFGTRCDALIRVSGSFVIDPSADQAHPGLHRIFNSVLIVVPSRTSWWDGLIFEFTVFRAAILRQAEKSGLILV
jgi:hypothetical protein